MTVITASNSEGIYGRCDAKCHGAKDPDCDCICGGRYHGAQHRPGGIHEAVQQYGDEVVERAKRLAQERGLTVEFSDIADLFAGMGES